MLVPTRSIILSDSKQRRSRELDHRLHQPGRVRKEGWISLTDCPQNRQQDSLLRTVSGLSLSGSPPWVCRRRDRHRRVEVVWSGVRRTGPLMRPPAVAEVEIPANRGAGRRHAGIGAQVDLRVFDRFPEAFDEDIVAPGVLGRARGPWSRQGALVAPGVLAVHADPDIRADRQAGDRHEVGWRDGPPLGGQRKRASKPDSTQPGRPKSAWWRSSALSRADGGREADFPPQAPGHPGLRAVL